jgi:hypothetical protein
MDTTTDVPLPGEQTPVTRVSVSDSVARTNSNWTVPGKKATVVAMFAPGAPHYCAHPALSAAPHVPAIPYAKPTTEDLGTQTFQGIEAHGYRVTSIIPTGEFGNDQPLTSITETWTATAPGLRRFVAHEVKDSPFIGKIIRELTNFTQAEPDASVFQTPADYEIVNKPAPGSACPADEGTESPTSPIPPSPPPTQ